MKAFVEGKILKKIPLHLGHRIEHRIKKNIYLYDPQKFDALKKINFYKSSDSSHKIRINLLINNINKNQMYGGIKTALDLFDQVVNELNGDARIIIQAPLTQETIDQYAGWEVDELENEHPAHRLLTSLAWKNGEQRKIDVKAEDIFMTTYWSTHYCVADVLNFQKEVFGVENKIIYLIQDFEPSFSAWSDNYLLCESTYHTPNTFAIINSSELAHYLHRLGYHFYHESVFFPRLTPEIAQALNQDKHVKKKKQILFYGRPNFSRNCFPLIIEAINHFQKEHRDLAKEWQFISIGSSLKKKVRLYDGSLLATKGKMPLADYANLLKESSVGISLMCSPHPSYPPLEMAAANLITITNQFVDKDMREFSNHIISLDYVTIENLSDTIYSAISVSEETDFKNNINPAFFDNKNQFNEILQEIKAEFLHR